jgi:anti-sigma B factor antagonist
MGAMAITTTMGAVTIVSVTGDIDVTNYYQMLEAVERALWAGSKQLVVDLSGVPFMSSAGLVAMQSIVEQVAAAGARLAVCGTGGAVHRLLQITGFTATLDIYPDLAAAVAAFSSDPLPGG